MGKIKIFGIVLSTIAAIGLVAVLIMSFVMPMGFWMGAEKAENFDDWSSTAGNGDSITVSGKIESREEVDLAGTAWYEFRFEGCDESFYSEKDLGSEGSRVIVTVKKTQIGNEASSQVRSIFGWAPNICCGLLSVVVVILGLLLLLLGLKKDKKAALEKPQQQSMQTQTPVQRKLTPAEAAAKRQRELNQRVDQTRYPPVQ